MSGLYVLLFVSATTGNRGRFAYRKESKMEKGDVVRHTFLRTRYVVERLTPKKAEVRAIFRDGRLSDSTTMVLRRNLELVEKAEQS